MRVAINLEQLLAPSPGGVGRYAAKLAAHLGGLGVDVVPVVARHSAAEVEAAWTASGLSAAGVPRPRRLPLPRPVLYDSWHVASWPRVDRAPDGGTVDVVHAPSLAVPPKGAARLVVSVHDAAPWRHPEAFSARGRWFHRAGLRAALGRADRILTGTEAAAEELEHLAGVPRGRTTVVPYGVDPATAPGPDAVRRVLGRYRLSEAPYVFWVGSLEPRKGVGTLVRAMAMLARRAGAGLGTGTGPGWALVLAGFPGWHNAGLLATEDVDVLGPALRRLGRVADDDLDVLYREASVFAFPSRHEGFGLPVLEAMAAGVPVVASDIPALREVAGGAAELVPADDAGAWAEAIRGLLDDGPARARRAEAGRRRAAALPWSATAQGTVDVYRQLVG